MTVNFDSVAEVIATLTDATDLTKKLDQLRSAALAADQKTKQAEALAEKYATADKLRIEAAAMLVRAKAKEVDLAHREAAIEPKDRALQAREKHIEQREAEVEHRERVVEQRAAHLDEIARTAAA